MAAPTTVNKTIAGNSNLNITDTRVALTASGSDNKFVSGKYDDVAILNNVTDSSLNFGDGNNMVRGEVHGSKISTGDGHDVMSFFGSKNDINASDGNNIIGSIGDLNKITVGSGQDTVNLSGSSNTATLNNGNDIGIIGNGSNNIMLAGDGADKVRVMTEGNYTDLGTNTGGGIDTYIAEAGSQIIHTGGGAHGNSTYTLAGDNNFISIDTAGHKTSGTAIYNNFNPDRGDKIYLNGQTFEELQSSGNIYQSPQNSDGTYDVIIKNGDNHTVILKNTTVQEVGQHDGITTDNSRADDFIPQETKQHHKNNRATDVAAGLLSAGSLALVLGMANYHFLRKDFKEKMNEKAQDIYASKPSTKTTQDHIECHTKLKGSRECEEFVKNSKKGWGMSGAVAGAGIGGTAIALTIGTGGIFALAALAAALGGAAVMGTASYFASEKKAKSDAVSIVKQATTNEENQNGKAREARIKAKYGIEKSEASNAEKIYNQKATPPSISR